MQLFALLVWVHLQAAALLVYPMFRVGGVPAGVMLCLSMFIAVLGVAVDAEEGTGFS